MRRILLVLIILVAAELLVAGDYFNKDRHLTASATVATGTDSTLGYDTTFITKAKGVNYIRWGFLFSMAAGPRGSHALVDSAFVALKSKNGAMWKTIDSFATALPDTTYRVIKQAAGDTSIFGDLMTVVVFDDSTSDSAWTITWDYEVILSAKE